MTTSDRPAMPVVMWLGNKFRIAKKIADVLPAGRRLVEPFVGSGAIFINTRYDRYLLSDKNSDLINLHKILQRDGERFIHLCQRYFTPEYDNKPAYKNMLGVYRYDDIDDTTRAAIYLYLNRHGFRGKMCYTKKGLLSTSYWRNRPYFPENEMREFHKKSQHAEFVVAGFEETMSRATAGDVVYCDPPYSPLGNSEEHFVRYTTDGFGADDHARLVSIAEQCADRGVYVAISNHDTESTRDLYRGATQIDTLQVARFFGPRETADELLAIYTPT